MRWNITKNYLPCILIKKINQLNYNNECLKYFSVNQSVYDYFLAQIR